LPLSNYRIGSVYVLTIEYDILGWYILFITFIVQKWYDLEGSMACWHFLSGECYGDMRIGSVGYVRVMQVRLKRSNLKLVKCVQGGTKDGNKEKRRNMRGTWCVDRKSVWE